MASITRTINVKNLVRELANNKVDALELVREALSNASDHAAKNVWIRTIRRLPPAMTTDLIVINDGEGMSEYQLQAFWGVSSSVKENPGRAIGYKGHGSKLFFSCRRLSVATRRSPDEPWMLSAMEEPLESSTMELEQAELPPDHPLRQELAAVGLVSRSGVAIQVEECRFHDNERFRDRRAVESYCDWFTIIGDIRSGLFRKREDFHDFVSKGNDHEQLRIHEAPLAILNVFLRINGEPKYTALGFGSSRPAVNHLLPWQHDADRWRATETQGMAAFGHRFADHFESDAGSGVRRVRDDRTALCLLSTAEFTNDPEYSVIIRVEGQRRQLDSYPEGSRQPIGGEFEFDQRFGLWLCKDFIPIVHRNDLLNRALQRATEKSKKRLRFDLSKTRFWQVFINNQGFLLTANRNDIANASRYEEQIVEMVATRIAEALREDAFREWIANLQRAVTATKKSKELDAMNERVEHVTDWFRKPAPDVEPTQAKLERVEPSDSLRLPKPTNEQELFYLYAVLSGQYRVPLRVIEYDTSLGVDAIAQVQNRELFEPPIAYARVEFKFSLQGNRAIGHFFDAIDAILCWTVTSTGELPEAGDTPANGRLQKRAKPRLVSGLDSHEVEYVDEKGRRRVIPVLVLERLFRKRSAPNRGEASSS